MSALSSIVDGAVAAIIAEHPKLFAEQHKDRAHKLITREIVKAFTREPKEGDETVAAEEPPPAFELLPAEDRRARAYINLRAMAGAVAPMSINGRISVPRAAIDDGAMALADLPPQAKWEFVMGPNLAAWLEFFEAALPDVARRKITTPDEFNRLGARLPWLWPPSKQGRTYTRRDDDEESEEADAGG